MSIRKKIKELEPINPYMSKTDASYEKLMLDMMSKLTNQIRVTNTIVRDQYSKSSSWMGGNKSNAKVHRKMHDEQFDEVQEFEDENVYGQISQVREETIQREKINPSHQFKSLKNNNHHHQGNLEKILFNLEKRLEASQSMNRILLEKLQKQEKRGQNETSRMRLKTPAKIEQDIILKAMKGGPGSNPKNSYNILSEILPHSDRREIKVKFRLYDVVNKKSFEGNYDLRDQTAEWLGMVYRATASICWNMLLNHYLTFDQVKILFTENIIFNFISLMNQLDDLGHENHKENLTNLINTKSIDILAFLCQQYPQTKIEAPNMALRQILPPIQNQGKIKYEIISKSGVRFIHRANADYTSQIMRVINFMIDQTSQQYDGFASYMRKTFEYIYVPINKRQKTVQPKAQDQEDDHSSYRQKVKSYTKYLIGRKISKNTAKYTDQQIQDGIFFVKSSAILRIITKWVEQLMEYVENPEASIKNNFSEKKDHFGNSMHLDSFVKNAIYRQTLKVKKEFLTKLDRIKQQCYKMQLLLTDQFFVEDNTQMHLSQEQIKVGMFCSNLKSAISSYICAELNQVIHFLLTVPREVNLQQYVPQQNAETLIFMIQKKKDLQNINFVTFKIFDLLRCKIHSNQQQIIWIVKYLLKESEQNKDVFNIVRIKDRLHLGTRDIMINAQINRGLVCQIQLAVTSQSDKKQELLDSYNHFLYELKRSNLGPLTENVSIWSNLEQRHAYFQLLRKNRMKKQAKRQHMTHQCGIDCFQTFKIPIICHCCKFFYAIPRTCLLNVSCKKCHLTICGQCFYYNYLSPKERKQFLFNGNKLIKNDTLQKLVEFTDFENSPLPQAGFFIKKNFLKKELSFYMSVQKDKVEGVKNNPNIEILIFQTVLRGNQIINRQLNKSQIHAKLEGGQFFVKKYQKTQLNNYIIFSFDKQYKKLMKLSDLQLQLKQQEHKNTKIINIIKEPSYINNLKLIKKQTEKVKEMNSLKPLIGDKKIVVYRFKNLFILAQIVINGKDLRSQIVKRLNTAELKKFVNQKNDTVSIEAKKITNQFDQLPSKLKATVYNSFAKNLKKLFLANNLITSIKCFANFLGLQAIIVDDNKIESLEGIEALNLIFIKFDNNLITSVQPLKNMTTLKSLYGSSNKITSIQGLENKAQLKIVSVNGNQIQSIKPIQNSKSIQELILSYNPIKDIGVISTLTGVNKLFLGNLGTNTIPMISPLKGLKSLSLQSNNLSSIPNIFTGFELHELFLGYNKITQINTCLKTQIELVRLNLAANLIQKIQNLEPLTALQFLKLSQNKITVISGVKNLDNLKHLNLKKNPIDSFGELLQFDGTFVLQYSEQCLTENAKNQLNEFNSQANIVSQGDDD